MYGTYIYVICPYKGTKKCSLWDTNWGPGNNWQYELIAFKIQVQKNWISCRIRDKYRVFNLKVNRILIWVIYLLRFTICYITQLTCIYSKCWKWCPFISMHLSTGFTMFLATFLSVLSFFTHFRNNTFYWRLPSKFFKETLSTVGLRHRF
jgi:hypothetical protein